ncbi:MAG: peptide/nickel transport system permease protein [Vicingaceae bacterium]|jgi:peptide/nickel transport system permease protein
MKSWKKNWAVYYFFVWACIALLAPILANQVEPNEIIQPLVPYSQSSIDYENSNSVSPFSSQQIESNYYRHWLGTDDLGRDVLSQLIHGSRTAFIIGFGVILLAGIIGILLGGIAGYFGDHSLMVSKRKLLTAIALFPFYILSITTIIPWDINAVSAIQKLILFGLFSMAYLFVLFLTGKIKSQPKAKIQLPIDLVISRIIELIDAIPLLFLLVCLTAIIEPSFFTTILIIASVAWTSIARYTRGEIIKVRNENYIQSAKALALNNFQILKKHILPNALGPVLVSLSFGMAAAILLEASLSFLGMGISAEEASWGKLIAAARNNYQAWWLAIFPGLAIFITVVASNKLSEIFQRKI